MTNSTPSPTASVGAVQVDPGTFVVDPALAFKDFQLSELRREAALTHSYEMGSVPRRMGVPEVILRVTQAATRGLDSFSLEVLKCASCIGVEARALH